MPIKFTEYGGIQPRPLSGPANAPVEGGGKKGMAIARARAAGRQLQAVRALQRPASGEGWEAACGAVFDLRTNALRPNGWTSADAAGLPIFPLLVRYPEVHAGQIDHALRVTVQRTPARLHPSRHALRLLSSSDPNLPPMGLRLRLKASYSLAGFHGESLVILRRSSATA